jgi:lipid A 3-O-deacylase PagL
MSRGLERLILVLVLLIPPFPRAQAQNIPTANDEKGKGVTTLQSGRNEFGLWAGYSPFSLVLRGVSEDRKLFLLNLQYARRLLVSTPVTVKYTGEIVPIAFQMQPRQGYLVRNKPLINPAATIYGAGASPIGFQANFGQKAIQPFANLSVGFLYFNRQVPIIGSSQFNYTITIGFGAQFFQRTGRSLTLGWKYHHLSNAYQASINPGIDSSVFYVGFSVPRLWRR